MRSASGSAPRATSVAEFAIVGSGPNSASPHHDASDRVIQAGEPIVLDIGGDPRRLRQRHDPDPVGDRRRRGERARPRSSATCSACCSRPRSRRPARSDRGSPARRSTGPPGTSSTAEGYGENVLPPDGSRDRARGARGALPRRRQRASRWPPGWRSASSPGSTCRAATAPGSRTSSSAARTARSS